MSDANHTISSCRHCAFYEVHGRRGGHCRQLGVSVQGRWKVCSLASPPFTSDWRSLERLVTLPAFEVQTATPNLLTEEIPLSPLDLPFQSEILSTQASYYELVSEESA